MILENLLFPKHSGYHSDNFPVNIFGFCKRLIESAWKGLKIWVQKPFIIEFFNVLCILFIKHLMINDRKTLQKINILMSEQ